jgi:hypothetical protein
MTGNRADWMSWILHFVPGFVIGMMGGCLVISRRHPSGFWLSGNLILPFLIGTAAIAGGIASIHGDRLWLGSSYRVIPPQGINHSATSLKLSRVIIGTGAMMSVGSLAAHFLR